MTDTQDSKLSSLREKLKENPTDILTYFNLIQLYKTKIEELATTTATDNKNDDNTAAYEQEISALYTTLHEKFPYYSPAYTLHIQDLLQRTEFEPAEKLLSQCLSTNTVNDLNLWLLYLDYVRRRNNLITGGQEARAVVIRAFELVMHSCAIHEPISGKFWDQYLGFLESWNPVNKWEEQSRVDMIRKLYRVMLCVPFDSLEVMWARYTAWEQDVNSLTARKFIGEISGSYMKARSLFKEWWSGVVRGNDLSGGLKRVVPVNLRSCNKNNVPSSEEAVNLQQLEIWGKWLNWERENKLELDEGKLRQRLMYVYKQAIQYMVFCPEMWYEYSIFCGGGSGNGDSDNDGTADQYQSGIFVGSSTANNSTSNSSIIQTNNNNNNNNNSISTSSNNSNNVSNGNSTGRDDGSNSCNNSSSSSSSNTIGIPTGAARSAVLEIGLRANPMSGVLTLKLAECYELENVVDKVNKVFETTLETMLERVQLLNQRLSQASEEETERENESNLDLELQSLKERMTFIYCVYMNTAMKLSGLSAARAVFSKCRKLKRNLTHKVYIENAYLEFQNQTDGYRTALKVLELGLKYFQSDGEYINKYLDFLMLLNRDSQIKTLFESSVDKIQDLTQLKSIFMKMIRYETKFGSVANVYSLEKRFIQRFSGESPIDIFSERYSLQHSNVLKKLELAYRYSAHGSNEGGDGDDDDYHPRDNNSKSRKRRRNISPDGNDNDDNDDDDRGRHGKRGTGGTGGSPINRKGLADSVPQPIIDLLKILPKRQYFKDAILDPENLVEYLVNQVEVPVDTKE